MTDTPPGSAAGRCDCGHGLLPPPWHHDNCPVLLGWLMKNVPEGEAEIAESSDLRSLRSLDGN